jgi:hypothetical protein
MKKNKILWVIIIIVCPLLAILCIRRWDVWLYNPKEPAYIASSEPAHLQMTFGRSGRSSRIVSWQCGSTLREATIAFAKLTDSILTIVPAAGRLIPTQGGATVCYHAQLDSLDDGEVYGYRLTVGDKSSAPHLFSTPLIMPDSAFRCVYFGDVQDTLGGITKQLFDTVHRYFPADFWLFGGDIIERPHHSYWAEYFHSVGDIAASLPMLAVAGNHEYLKGIPNRLEERFPEVFPILKQEDKPFATCDIRYGNTAFILLDSNRAPWQLLAQREWFRQALIRAQGATFKVVVLHHPPLSVRGKWNNLLVRCLFLPLMYRYHVDLVLAGHEHVYARKITTASGKPTTPVFIIGQSSPKDYPIQRTNRYDRYGNRHRFFQTIDINHDSLVLKTYNDSLQLYDYVIITRQNGKTHVFDNAKGWREYFHCPSDACEDAPLPDATD